MVKKSLSCIRIFIAVAIGFLAFFHGDSAFGQICDNGVTAGGFDGVAPGVYPAPGYINGWKAAGTDEVKVVTQGTSNGALIRSRGAEQYSLEQTIYSIKPSFDYTMSFTYGNWTNGCTTSARAGILVSVYFDGSTVPAVETEYIANDATTSSIGLFQFTTPAVVSTVRIVIRDFGSPPPTCGTVIDDIKLMSPLTVSTTTTSVVCFGDSNGGFTVTASGGAAPYTATYSPNGSPAVALPLTDGQGSVSNLAAGDYTVNITDGNNCTVTRTITVPGPASALSISAVPVMCYGEANGSVMVTATGGTAPYTYTLNGSSNTTGYFTNLPAGTYTVTAVDQNLCPVSTTFTISQPSNPLAASAVPTNVSCYGMTDGTVQVTATGGVAPYRYELNGTTNTTGTFSGLPAGSYTVRVTDANNCTVFAYTTLSQPARILPAVTSTEVTCYGGTDGSVTVSATGGSGQLSYTINGNTNQNGIFTNMPAGTYTVRIQDASGCYVETTVTVSQPVSELMATAIPAKCFGEPSGSITVTATGGTPGYTYTLNGTTIDNGYFDNLTAGFYQITVTDSRGCTTIASATIGEPNDPLTLTASVFNNNCRGGSTGTVTAVASGGIPGYTFRLNDAVNSTGNFSGLAAGTYTVFAQDANGCAASIQVTIQEPATTITATATPTNALCFADANGSIQVVATGGTPGYTFTLNQVTNRTGTFTGLAAGSYTITVTDAIGCSISTTATVVAPPLLTVAARPVWCFGETTASVTLTAAGGTPGYRYRLNGVTNTTGIFTGLAAGTYDFVTTDANNCSVTTRVILTPPTSAMTLNVVSRTNIACFGEATGSVTFSVTGGTGPYLFALNDSTNTTGHFDRLPSGTYTGSVTDANGCRSAVTVQILEMSTAIRPVVSTTAARCAGESNGSLRVTATGGSPGYTFSLNGTTNSTGVFNSLPAGTYTILVTDQRGCTVTVTGVVSEPSAPLTISARPEMCRETDGSVIITASGGTAPYTYHLNGRTNTTGIFTPLQAGTYQVLVTDANNCAVSGIVTLSVPANPFSAAVTGKTDVSCFGSSSGSVQVSAQGGVPGYTFTLNGVSNTSGFFSGLPAGTHTIVITDMNGCRTETSVTITQPSAALSTASLVVTPVNCPGSRTGAITVVASGGTAPYRYTLNGTSNTTGVFTGLAVGTYQVVITDALNCTITASAMVTQIPPLSITAGSSDASCFGESNGSITAHATGGTPGYTYSVNGTTNTTGVFTGLPAGAYVVRVQDNSGCTTMTQVTISEPPAITGNVSAAHATVPGATDGIATITAGGGIPGYTYSLNGITNTTGIFTGLAAGEYSAEITDFRGCVLLLPFTIETLNRVDLTPVMTVIPEGRTASVTATLREPFKDDVYITIGYSGSAIEREDYLLTGQYQTIRIPRGSVSTTERLVVNALSDAITEADEDVLMEILSTSDPLVLIGDGAAVVIQDILPDDPLTNDPVPENKDIFPDPTVSPNDDGQGNDHFNIGNILSFPENEVLIFNRWGNPVFKVKGYNTTDKVFRGFANTGIATNRPAALVDGVYYYVIYTFKTVGSEKERRLNKGYLILKR